MKNGYLLVVSAILLSLIASSCENDLPLAPYGRIEVRCSLIYINDTKSIDAYQLNLTKVRLMQDRRIVTEVDLDVDKPAKTGRYVFSNLQSGTYDVLVLIGETNEKFDYVSKADITIARADNGTRQMPRFDDYRGTLNYYNTFDEATPKIEGGKVTLYEHNTDVPVITDKIDSMPAMSLEGSFVDRYPDEYTLFVSLNMKFNGVVFEAFNSMQGVDIAYGRENWVNINGIQTKVGRLVLDCANGDQTPPQIVDGPFVTYNYDKDTGETYAIIKWTTDKAATSNVCYSEKKEFTYLDSPHWAPPQYDYIADTKEHTVSIPDFKNDPANPWYFVVVTSDSEGDMNVSTEIKIPTVTMDCAKAILAKRVDILPFYEENDWDIKESNWVKIILNWSTADTSGGFLREWALHEECYCTN